MHMHMFGKLLPGVALLTSKWWGHKEEARLSINGD